MFIGKYAVKRRIWEKIVWKERRANHVKGKGSKLQRKISK